jgi:hypothetical protein
MVEMQTPVNDLLFIQRYREAHCFPLVFIGAHRKDALTRIKLLVGLLCGEPLGLPHVQVGLQDRLL